MHTARLHGSTTSCCMRRATGLRRPNNTRITAGLNNMLPPEPSSQSDTPDCEVDIQSLTARRDWENKADAEKSYMTYYRYLPVTKAADGSGQMVQVKGVVLVLQGFLCPPSGYQKQLKELAANSRVAVYAPAVIGPPSRFPSEEVLHKYQAMYFEDIKLTRKRIIEDMEHLDSDPSKPPLLPPDCVAEPNIILLGYSMGGMLAFRYMHKFADEVKAVIAMSPAPEAAQYSSTADKPSWQPKTAIEHFAVTGRRVPVLVVYGRLDAVSYIDDVTRCIVRPLCDNNSFDVTAIELATGFHTTPVAAGWLEFACEPVRFIRSITGLSSSRSGEGELQAAADKPLHEPDFEGTILFSEKFDLAQCVVILLFGLLASAWFMLVLYIAAAGQDPNGASPVLRTSLLGVSVLGCVACCCEAAVCLLARRSLPGTINLLGVLMAAFMRRVL